MLLRFPALTKAPMGSGTVMSIPGFGTNDSVLIPLRAFLRTRGYRTTGWGQGRNRGNVFANLNPVTARVERLVAASGGTPIALVGFSLGGVFAREVARDRPDLVSCVCTFGTPLFADNDQQIERNQTPIKVPITAIHSKNDRVVDWRGSIDTFSPDVSNFEVESSHAGLTIDPDVWLIVSRALASCHS